MSTKKIGFIGCGNIANAIITGMISSEKIKDSQIYLLDQNNDALESLKRRYININVADNMSNIINNSDIIFLCIKPHILSAILKEISESSFKNDLKLGTKVLISVCAGKTIDDILNEFEDRNIYCIRVMPNLTLSICSGCWLYCENPNVDFISNKYNSSEDIIEILKCCGTVYPINEDIFSQCTTISGCGPGFFSNIIHHFIEAGVKIGVPENLANKLVLETIYGTSKMILRSSQDPLSFQKKVCTPGGSTEAGINILENGGIDELFQDCLKSSLDKCIELGKK